MQSISLHELHNLYFRFSDGLSSSTSSTSNDMMFRAATANAKCRISRLQRKFASTLQCVQLHFQRHSTSNLWIGRLLFFLRCAGRHFRTYSLIFALLQQGWFSDARIPPEITRWTPVWPGKNRPCAANIAYALRQGLGCHCSSGCAAADSPAAAAACAAAMASVRRQGRGRGHGNSSRGGGRRGGGRRDIC